MKLLAFTALLTGALASAQVTGRALLDSQRDAASWLMYGRNYSAWRYSELADINAGNVSRLVPQWIFQTGIGGKFETTPIVHNGLMYLTAPSNHAFAVDVATGRPVWHYAKPVPRGVNLCCGQVNRGFAMLGDVLYRSTSKPRSLPSTARPGSRSGKPRSTISRKATRPRPRR
jgi:alcohol dehydrogenase (cytochrome c)